MYEGLTYGELLEKREWKEKRSIILSRDNYTCRTCNLEIERGFTLSAMINDSYFMKVKERERDEYMGEVERMVYRHLHVHHTYYFINVPPWEYPNEALITLCDKCHCNLHLQAKIPVYKKTESGKEEVEVELCKRCNGSGWFPQYKEIEAGVCFECRGARFFYK